MKDINNLQKHVQDERKAVLDKDPGPKDSIDYSQLRGMLEASWRTIYDPSLAVLHHIRQQQSQRIGKEIYVND